MTDEEYEKAQYLDKQEAVYEKCRKKRPCRGCQKEYDTKSINKHEQKCKQAQAASSAARAQLSFHQNMKKIQSI